MQIERVDVYRIRGQSFESEAKAREWIADQIGERMQRAIRAQGCVLHPRDEIRIVDAVLANTATLLPLLGAYVAPVEND